MSFQEYKKLSRRLDEQERRLSALENRQNPVPDFASDEAAERWQKSGRPSLLGMTPSGKTGYTVADVKTAVEDAGQTEADDDGESETEETE